MQMDPNDIKTFKAFYRYVSVNIPEVSTVGVIIEAMRDLSGKVDSATIKGALKWGQGPTIKIVKNLGADGEFTMGVKSQEIRINHQRVQDFEDGAKGKTKKHLGRTKYGKLVYMVGVTLLHELTHWADDQDGVDDPVPGDPTNEEGWAFEKAVYGRVTEPWK